MGITADMNRFSIRDIENLTGIKAHTIRIWEQRYGILQPKRTPTNIRYYDATDLKYALRIALLNDYGYKISRIQEMSEEEINNVINKINDQEFQLQAQVNKMLETMLTLDTDLFEALITAYIKKNGIEMAVERLLFSFLEKVGIMWMTDRIFPAQEHIMSNIVYRKLALAIEQLPKNPDAGPSVLLFLPEGEIHDIGLMYVHYLLLKHGKKPIYLGPNSPVKDVQLTAEMKKPDYAFIHLTSVASEFDSNKYLKKLTETLPGITILVSGSMLKHTKLQSHPRIVPFYSLQQVKNYILSLS